MDKKEENIPPSLLKGLSFMTTAYNMRIRNEIKQDLKQELNLEQFKSELKLELEKDLKEQLKIELQKMKKEVYQYIDYEIKKYGENHEIIHDYIKIN
jgi:hypothetical protein